MDEWERRAVLRFYCRVLSERQEKTKGIPQLPSTKTRHPPRRRVQGARRQGAYWLSKNGLARRLVKTLLGVGCANLDSEKKLVDSPDFFLEDAKQLQIFRG